MQLVLTPLAGTTRGIYTTQSNGPHSLPTRFLFLHPSAAQLFNELEAATGGLVYSDILRSAEESLAAMQQKSGVQPPGYSGHNFGFSFDCAVVETMALRSWSYTQLLETLAAHGWYCHRRDGQQGGEAWHFNAFGTRAPDYLAHADAERPVSWAAPLEAMIQDVYGAAFKLQPVEVQMALRKLGLLAGPADGIIGPHSEAAIACFQRAWKLPDTGDADERTQRVLAFVAADRQVV